MQQNYINGFNNNSNEENRHYYQQPPPSQTSSQQQSTDNGLIHGKPTTSMYPYDRMSSNNSMQSLQGGTGIKPPTMFPPLHPHPAFTNVRYPNPSSTSQQQPYPMIPSPPTSLSFQSGQQQQQQQQQPYTLNVNNLPPAAPVTSNVPLLSNSPPNVGDSNADLSLKRPRRVAKLACVSCRKAHACCEDTRPCSRCVAHGLQCIDVQGKKRGRKKKSKEDSTEENVAEKPIKKRQTKKKTEPQPKRRKKNEPAAATTTTTSATVPEQSTSTASSQPTIPQQPITQIPQNTATEVSAPNGQNQLSSNVDPTLFSNQPPEIQQLASMLMNSNDTFYLHNTNLNVSDLGTDNLFGTPVPFEDLGYSPARDGTSGSATDRNIPSPGSFFDDGGGLFGSISPINFLFAPLVQERNSPQPLKLESPADASSTATLSPSATFLPKEASAFFRNPSNSPSIPSSSNELTIPDDVSNLTPEEKNRTSQVIMKGVEPGVRKIVEESVRTMQRAESNDGKNDKQISFMEYLHKNFASSLMLQNSQLQQENAREKEERQQLVQYKDKDEEIAALRRENQHYKQESFRKSNSVALLTALNESLRGQLDEMIGARKQMIEGSNSSTQAQPIADSATREQNRRSTEKSYQELCQLMQNKQEMDSSTFGIMLCFPGGRIISLNKTLLDKLGYGPEDLFDRLERWEDVIHQSYYSTVVAQLTKLLKAPPAPRKSFKVKVGCRSKANNQPVMSELYTCMVGGRNAIPVFVISYFLFSD